MKILLTIMLLPSLTLFSQTFEWAKSMGGVFSDAGNSIITDDSGNVYVTGYYFGTVDFNPSTATFNLTSNGSYDYFIQKLDGNGNFIWAKSIGGTSIDLANFITIDGMGNVYITGYYQGTVDFDPDVATFNLISNGSSDIFLQKLDTDGNFIWAKSMGSIFPDEGLSITTDIVGNVYITGLYQGTVDFDPSGTTFNMSSNGLGDFFIQKLDGGGNFIWAKSIGGTSDDRGYSITADGLGNVYVTGYYQGTVDFDPSAAIFNLTSNGGEDVFIQKLDTIGNFVWVKSVGQGMSSDDEGLSITTDSSGNVYITGYYQGTVDFDPGAATFNLTSNGVEDVFIQKLDESGNFIWAKSMGGISYDYGYSITTDGSGNLFVTGMYQDIVDFDPGTDTFNLTSNGSGDVFIQKLDESGNFIWAKSVGGISGEAGRSVITNTLGNVYITGSFQKTVDFDPSMDTFNLTSNGQFDIFIAKYASCGYIDTSVSVFGSTITANMSGAYYQWINCDNSFSPISGEINQSFQPTIAGNYAVIISDKGCSDTSSCYTITGIKILEYSNIYNIWIYPNPTTDNFLIDLSGYLNKVELGIINILGQQVLLAYYIDEQTIDVNVEELNPGTYFLQIRSSDFTKVLKVIIK